MNFTKILSLSLSLFFSVMSFSQETDLGAVSGNFQIISQYYNSDTLINAILPDHKMGLNSFANVNYNKGNFSAGIRYESYLNPIEGYPTSFNGTGLGYRYANWKNKSLDVTIGNFYEQYGSGLILRAYEERNLGIDNALDGVKIKYTPYQGVYLKAFAGKQRYIFQDGLTNGTGIIRGFDGEINLNELLDSVFSNSKLRITIGGSFVSKFNEDNLTPNFVLPKNVGSYGGRIGLRYGKLRFSGEYIVKENDPYPDSQDDRFNYIYKNGEGILLNLGYSTKGFAIDFSAKHNDNMLWRSTNVAVGPTDLLVGFVPTLTKQHTYSLASTLYPYATNARGEIAFQSDVIYRIPKKTKIGGKYGTVISLNYATAFAPKREYLNDMTTTRKGYKTIPFSFTDSLFLQDFNVEIKRKFNKKLKASVNYFNFVFDDRAILVAKVHELIYAQIFVLDITQKIDKKHSIRYEAQHLSTKQDQGNWAFGQIEYTFGSHWSFAILDQFNYGNKQETLRLHYLLGNIGYVSGPHRFSFQYGRQRAGIFCVGGVCRAVPASNGLTFTVTSSF